jgi:hypothetical protein
MEHESHDLICPKNIAVLPPILGSYFHHIYGSSQPEEGEEAMKGGIGAHRILPIKCGELAGKDQVTEFASSFF